jgi:cytochrome c biogenesis protein CcmG, thiol:disulfide interchange protein DsbE
LTEENNLEERDPAACRPARSRWSGIARSWAPVVALSVLVLGAALVGGNLIERSQTTPPGPLGLAADTISHAPDFRVIAYQGEDVLGGEEANLSDLLAQGKPVVLNFWAGQCPPCRVEMPHLGEVAAEYQGRVVVLGLDVGPFVGLGTREDGLALLEELQVTFPAGTTEDGQVVRDYQVLGMPTTLFISPSGRVTNKWSGLLTQDRLVDLVEDLLERS